MITRIDRVMSELKAAGKKGIFIYITAGAPDMKTALEAVKKAEAAGANVIELGLPFSDPMADGPVIQTASVVALKNGMTLAKEMELVRDIRKDLLRISKLRGWTLLLCLMCHMKNQVICVGFVPKIILY